MAGSAHLEAQGFVDETLEGGGVTAGGPELELRVALRAHLQQRVFTAVVELQG
jgi:hypothetical protein